MDAEQSPLCDVHAAAMRPLAVDASCFSVWICSVATCWRTYCPAVGYGSLREEDFPELRDLGIISRGKGSPVSL